MPREVEPYWKGRVFQLADENPNLGSTTLHKLLKEEVGKEAYSPSERWVFDVRKEWEGMRQEKEAADYRSFDWPRSMGSPDLPWEAGATALELLRLTADDRVRPTVRVAKWFWRVTLAAPDSPPATRLFVARLLAAQELAGNEPDSRTTEVLITPETTHEQLDEIAGLADGSGVRRTR